MILNLGTENYTNITSEVNNYNTENYKADENIV